MAGPVHYELYIRKTAPSPWTLLLATENRASAMAQAEDLLADNRAAAVRVTKETLDPDTGEFASLTVFNRGLPEPPRPKVRLDDGPRPACATVADLYGPAARELIARALEPWLARRRVTAFELMHRPDLVEQLEAAGVEFQHAVQKVAVPESQASGQPVHELIRHYQKLAHAGIERLILAGRKGLFADLTREPVAELARRLAGDPERAFLMGGAISARLAPATSWRERLEILMDLADAAPQEIRPNALVQVVIEQILVEMMGVRAAVDDILGEGLDPGGALAALVRLAAPREVERLLAVDPRLGGLIPPVDGPAARLGARLQTGQYRLLAAALARRVLRELTGPRRLRPSDARGEIEILRALAAMLTASAGRLLSADDVQAAFAARSRSLVAADFVHAYVKAETGALDEARALVRLAENVTGAANKRAAGRWLAATASAVRFEAEARADPRPAAARLAALAELHRGVCAAGLAEHDRAGISAALGAVGDRIEADARLIAQLVRAAVPPARRLAALLRLAAGDTAPPGPAADRARAEAARLLRAPETRAALTADPEALRPLRDLLQAAGLTPAPLVEAGTIRTA